MNKIKGFLSRKSKRKEPKSIPCHEELQASTPITQSASEYNVGFQKERKELQFSTIKVTSVSPRSPLSSSPLSNHFTFDFTLYPNANQMMCCSTPTSPSSPVRKWSKANPVPLLSRQLYPNVSSQDLRSSAENISEGKLKISDSATLALPVDALTNSSGYNTGSLSMDYFGVTNSRDERITEQEKRGSSPTGSAVSNTTIMKRTRPENLNLKNSLAQDNSWNGEDVIMSDVQEQEHGTQESFGKLTAQSEALNMFSYQVNDLKMASFARDDKRVEPVQSKQVKLNENPFNCQPLENKFNIQLASTNPRADHDISKMTKDSFFQESVFRESKQTLVVPGLKYDRITNGEETETLCFKSILNKEIKVTPGSLLSFSPEHRFQGIMELDEHTRQMLEIDIIRPLVYI